MLKKVLIGIAALVGILLIVIATRPAAFEVRRSLVMKAPPEIVYAQVNDFKTWSQWSPWDNLDPTQKRIYSDVSSGVGATYHWIGNDQVGEGTMTITDAKPNAQLGIDLIFIKPFAAKNRTVFDFTKSGPDSTTVTWSMTGENDFMGKAFGLVMNMDKMVGGDFEKGLAQMKAVSESAAAKAQAETAQPAAEPVPEEPAAP